MTLNYCTKFAINADYVYQVETNLTCLPCHCSRSFLQLVWRHFFVSRLIGLSSETERASEDQRLGLLDNREMLSTT